MIDWHCHILPGLDDGAVDMEQSLAMAAALAKAGFRTIYCTPHRMPGCYSADNDQVRQGVAELQQRLQDSNIPLRLQTGCEYSLDEYLLASLDDPLPLGESRLILVEILPRLTAAMVRQVLYDVVQRGFTPVIAHPERCLLLAPVVPRAGSHDFFASIKNLLGGGHRIKDELAIPGSSGNPLLEYLRELGCSFQGNLGSFKGCYGRRVQVAAQTLKELGVYDRYGSDLHAPEQAKVILAPPISQ
ncbi:MAG: phosphoesterase [Desulfuromonadales bacterium]|nr:phosphoesterase [Desulfuromonadales bacterium]